MSENIGSSHMTSFEPTESSSVKGSGNQADAIADLFLGGDGDVENNPGYRGNEEEPRRKKRKSLDDRNPTEYDDLVRGEDGQQFSTRPTSFDEDEESGRTSRGDAREDELGQGQQHLSGQPSSNDEASLRAFGAPAHEQLENYRGWIKQQAQALDVARANNQITDQQHQQGGAMLQDHVRNFQNGALARREANVKRDNYIRGVVDDLSTDIPEFKNTGSRVAVVNQMTNFMRDDLGLPNEVIKQINHPAVVKAVYKVMKELGKVSGQNRKQAQQINRLRSKARKKTRMYAEDTGRNTPNATEDIKPGNRGAQINAVAELLMGS